MSHAAPINRSRRARPGTVAYNIVKTIVLASFLILITFPFIWLLISSFKSIQEIFNVPITYWPRSFTFDNYLQIFRIGNFGRYVRNSAATATSGAGIAVVAALMAAYVLSRFKFRLRKYIIGFYLLTQMLPGFVGLVPLYGMLASWKMIDWLPTLTVLNMASLIPFSCITLMGFYETVPVSIEEAALIDGATRVKTLILVVLPVILPGVSAVFIFGFVQAWNNLFAPVLYMNRDSNYTIPVALNAMVLKNSIRWAELSAGAVVAIIPTIVMFGFVQRYVATGLTAGAVKG
jgi:multiple sugar transport system permease protein